MMRNVLAWIKNARYPSLPQSVFPAVAAVCLAMKQDGFSWWWALCACLGVAAAHLASNLTDDYADYQHNRELIRSRLADNPLRKEKCDYLFSGAFSLQQLKKAIIVFIVVASVFAAAIGPKRGLPILYLVLATALLAYFYSGAPLHLSYHGMGEILIGIVFGPLLMTGVCFSACGHLNGELLWISVAAGLLVFNIVFTHSVMDVEADAAIGKKTLAVLFPDSPVQLFFSFLGNVVPFVWVEIGILAGILPFVFHWVWLAFPLALALFWLMCQHFSHPERRFRPKWWMGPMPVKQWDAIEKLQLDAFMLRWFMARNLTSLFCIIIIVISFI